MHSAYDCDREARVRVLREAATMARIRHPNVVDISDVGIEHGHPLVMELLEGRTWQRCWRERDGSRLSGRSR
jgi:serine/threonine protein kinase